MTQVLDIEADDLMPRLRKDSSPWGVWHIHRMATGRVEVRPGPISPEWTPAERAVLNSMDQATTTRLKPVLSFGPWWFAIELAQRVARIHSSATVRERVYRPGWTNQGATKETR